MTAEKTIPRTWLNHIIEYKKSNMKLSNWCKKGNIDKRAFTYWMAQLTETDFERLMESPKAPNQPNKDKDREKIKLEDSYQVSSKTLDIERMDENESIIKTVPDISIIERKEDDSLNSDIHRCKIMNIKSPCISIYINKYKIKVDADYPIGQLFQIIKYMTEV